MAMGVVIIILVLQTETPSHRQVIQRSGYSRQTLALSYSVNCCIMLLPKRGFRSQTEEVV